MFEVEVTREAAKKRQAHRLDERTFRSRFLVRAVAPTPWRGGPGAGAIPFTLMARNLREDVRIARVGRPRMKNC